MKRIIISAVLALSILLSILLMACSNKNSVWLTDYIVPVTNSDSFMLVQKSSNEGIYPDDSILENQNNPFHDVNISDTYKWDIASYDTSKYCNFQYYMWATYLVYNPSGEAQFYVAQALETAGMDDSAIKAYQNVMDLWPECVSYAANGVDHWRLGPKAYTAIEGLNGTPLHYTLADPDSSVDGDEYLVPLSD